MSSRAIRGGRRHDRRGGVGAVAPGWLRTREFDLTFIVGIAAIALLSAFAGVREPALVLPILFVGLWLLGYHHVVATFTRLSFHREGFRTHRFLVVWLPPLILAAVLALAFGVGLCWWVVTRVLMMRRGGLPLAHTLYMLSHFTVFSSATS